MNGNEQKVFSDMPVKSAVFKMAIPSVVSSLVLVIYNMADTFFVGQTTLFKLQQFPLLTLYLYCLWPLQIF